MLRIESAIRLGALAAATLALACGGGDSPSGDAAAPEPTARQATPAAPAAADSADAAAEAEQIFATRCFTCHGSAGAGDGPGSAGLTPPPRDFRDPAWQAEVSDEHIANIIMYGGAAVGRSPTMPGNPDLAGRPEVVEALVVYVRNLKAD